MRHEIVWIEVSGAAMGHLDLADWQSSPKYLSLVRSMIITVTDQVDSMADGWPLDHDRRGAVKNIGYYPTCCVF